MGMVNDALSAAIIFAILINAHCLPASAEDQPSPCADSDRGKNYHTLGVITWNGRVVWSDSCVNPSQLQEGYCDSRLRNRMMTVIYECPRGCFRGSCSPSNNTWVAVELVSVVQSMPEARQVHPLTLTPSYTTTTSTTIKPQVVELGHGLVCTDSDGGGDNLTRGVVAVNGKVVWSDVCVNPDQLEEGLCDKARRLHYRAGLVTCPNGCRNGACRR